MTSCVDRNRPQVHGMMSLGDNIGPINQNGQIDAVNKVVNDVLQMNHQSNINFKIENPILGTAYLGYLFSKNRGKNKKICESSNVTQLHPAYTSISPDKSNMGILERWLLRPLDKRIVNVNGLSLELTYHNRTGQRSCIEITAGPPELVGYSTTKYKGDLKGNWQQSGIRDIENYVKKILPHPSQIPFINREQLIPFELMGEIKPIEPSPYYSPDWPPDSSQGPKTNENYHQNKSEAPHRTQDLSQPDRSSRRRREQKKHRGIIFKKPQPSNDPTIVKELPRTITATTCSGPQLPDPTPKAPPNDNVDKMKKQSSLIFCHALGSNMVDGVMEILHEAKESGLNMEKTADIGKKIVYSTTETTLKQGAISVGYDTLKDGASKALASEPVKETTQKVVDFVSRNIPKELSPYLPESLPELGTVMIGVQSIVILNNARYEPTYADSTKKIIKDGSDIALSAGCSYTGAYIGGTIGTFVGGPIGTYGGAIVGAGFGRGMYHTTHYVKNGAANWYYGSNRASE